VLELLLVGHCDYAYLFLIQSSGLGFIRIGSLTLNSSSHKSYYHAILISIFTIPFTAFILSLLLVSLI
jgi:hypothetical protein